MSRRAGRLGPGKILFLGILPRRDHGIGKRDGMRPDGTLIIFMVCEMSYSCQMGYLSGRFR
jgi:hypothetical protein